jgi:hypothetical protein
MSSNLNDLTTTCLLLVAAAMPIPPAFAVEGLFRPDQVAVPEPVSGGLDSVVRVVNQIAFDTNVFPDTASRDEFRRRHPARNEKIFNQEGALWPVDVTFEALTELCGGPVREQPANAELCAAFARTPCPSHECSFVTDRLKGSATGFVVGRAATGNLLVMTAYHVAREGIERLRRTGGVCSARAQAIPDLLVVLRDAPDQSHAVSLVANASAKDWHEGRDWALLEVHGTSANPHKALAISRRPVQLGEQVWVAGFPTRTSRKLSASSPYQNAADELRISLGEVMATPSDESGSASDVLADADGVAGNSGSPAFDVRGMVVGLFRAHTLYRNGNDERMDHFGGLAQLVPASVLAEGLACGAPRLRQSTPLGLALELGEGFHDSL